MPKYSFPRWLMAALGLAALGFVSTLALAKYIADEQMF